MQKDSHHRRTTYQCWQDMRQRCSNPKNHNYKNYGGRGIKVCTRWQESFFNFLCDMGLKPAGLTLERKDTNGNYEPENCCWADRLQQRRNRRDCQFIEYKGERLPVEVVARRVGVDPETVRRRLKRGFTVGEALRTKTILRGSPAARSAEKPEREGSK